jgi:hypothetical protein
LAAEAAGVAGAEGALACAPLPDPGKTRGMCPESNQKNRNHTEQIKISKLI